MRTWHCRWSSVYWLEDQDFLSLIAFHGSFNWANCAKCPKTWIISRYLFEIQLKKTKTLHFYARADEGTSICDSPSNTSMKAVAMFRCCCRLQWFSIDKMIGNLHDRTQINPIIIWPALITSALNIKGKELLIKTNGIINSQICWCFRIPPPPPPTHVQIGGWGNLGGRPRRTVLIYLWIYIRFYLFYLFGILYLL